MIRAFLAACLALLLVGMQHEQLVHALEHLRASIARGDDVEVQKPPAECLDCALLASGANSLPADDDAALPRAPARAAKIRHFESARAASPPAFYRSRAPPVLL